MNRFIRLAAVPLVVLAAACSSPGYKQSESAAAHARMAKGAAAGFEKQTQLCLDTMAALFAEPYQDLPSKYQRFSQSVSGLASANYKLGEAVSAFDKAAGERFRSWDAENSTFTDRELRAHSEARRDQVFGIWQKARGPMVEGVDKAGALNGEFAGLRKLLSNDLSPGGLESATPLAAKIRTDAQSVLEATREWTTGLDEAIDSLSTGPTSTPAAAPAPTPAK